MQWSDQKGYFRSMFL